MWKADEMRRQGAGSRVGIDAVPGPCDVQEPAAADQPVCAARPARLGEPDGTVVLSEHALGVPEDGDARGPAARAGHAREPAEEGAFLDGQ